MQKKEDQSLFFYAITTTVTAPRARADSFQPITKISLKCGLSTIRIQTYSRRLFLSSHHRRPYAFVPQQM